MQQPHPFIVLLSNIFFGSILFAKMSKVAAEVAKAGKIAGQYFEKREKGLLYHADVLSHTDWLLCNSAASNNEEAATQQPSILLEGAIKQFTTTVLSIKLFLIQVCFHLMMMIAM